VGCARLRLRRRAISTPGQELNRSTSTRPLEGAALNELAIDRKRSTFSNRLTIVPRLELVIDDESRDDAELTTLVAHARTGSAAAFEELARRVRSRVRRWAGRLVRDGDDAEDVTQLVLLRLHARIGDYEGRSRFTSWLYRVTRNLALDHRRTAERRRALLAPEMSRANASSAPDFTAAPDVAARDDDAARLARLVRAYFTELPPRQREVFEMADLHGRAPSEIAAALGIAPSTVRVLLLKARRTIRSRMLAEHPRLLEEYRS